MTITPPAIIYTTLLERLQRAEQESREANYHRYLRFRGTKGRELIALELLPAANHTSRMALMLAITDMPEASMRLISEAEERHNPAGIYVHQNELHPHVAARYPQEKLLACRTGEGICNADIVTRRAFYVDIDPIRGKGVSATDAERDCAFYAAHDLRSVMVNHLGDDRALGVGSSGNGTQLHFALASLDPKEAEGLIRDIQGACARLVDTDKVKVDTTVADARRTCPAFGTMKRKGADHRGPRISPAEARPHRRTAFICADEVRRLTLDELRDLRDKLVASAPEPAANATVAVQASSAEADDNDPWQRARSVDIEQVSEWLGLGVGSDMKCPGCGSVSGYGRIPNTNLVKCHHSSCSAKGVPAKGGTRTAIDLVVEARGLKPLRAVKQLAKQFGFEPPARAKAHPALSASGAAWEAELLRDERDGLKSQSHNVTLILQNDSAWQGVLGFNELRNEVVFLATPPGGFLTRKVNDAWQDEDDIAASNWLQKHWGISLGTQSTRGVVSLVAHQHAFHPVREDLATLTWDGNSRVDSWLTRYLGVETGLYTSMVGRWWLISAVARAFVPGCKVDTLLILEGEQGLQKSTALQALAGKNEYFLDDLREVGGVEGAKQLRGKWIVEIAELDAFRGRENTQIKRFLSQQSDNYRPSFGRSTLDFPRQCVFAGTTNKDDYLRDETGARRFWPVRCTNIDLDALRRDRDQLWAEAVHLFRAGEVWWPNTVEETQACEIEQDQRQATDDWTAAIVEYVADKNRVTTEEVLRNALGLEVSRINDRDTKRVAAVLHRMGWRRRKTRVDAPEGKRQIRVFERPDPLPAKRQRILAEDHPTPLDLSAAAIPPEPGELQSADFTGVLQ